MRDDVPEAAIRVLSGSTVRTYAKREFTTNPYVNMREYQKRYKRKKASERKTARRKSK